MKRFFRKTLCSLLFSAFMLGGSPVIADEITIPPAIEKELEQKVSSKSILELNLNFGAQSEREEIDFSSFYNAYHRNYNFLSSNFPDITISEKLQIENLVQDVKLGNVDSYQELLESSEDLSENQKLVLLSAIGNLLAKGSYDSNYNGDSLSREEFFEGLQDYLITGEDNPVGVCGDIHTIIEELANDLDIPAAAVSGMSGNMVGHIYSILNIEDGTAIIDYGRLFTFGTKNIERALEAYQENRGTVRFQHRFYNEGLFQYRFITKDGENYNEAVNYDGSSEVLKNSLIQRDSFKSSGLEINVGLKNYLTSLGINYFGAFVNVAQIRGSEASPLQRMNLVQTGLRKGFDRKYLNIDSELSFIFGNLVQDKELEDDDLLGANLNFVLASDFESVFNFTSRLNGNLLGLKPVKGESYHPIFFDLGFGFGASFKIPVNENVSIEPYSVAQFNLLPADVRTFTYKPFLSDLKTGINLDFRNFSLDAYFLKELGDTLGFGGEINANLENINFNLGGYWKKSDYEFCPDNSWGLDFNLGVNSEHASLGINYKLDGTNYDSERENTSSIGINLNFQ